MYKIYILTLYIVPFPICHKGVYEALYSVYQKRIPSIDDIPIVTQTASHFVFVRLILDFKF